MAAITEQEFSIFLAAVADLEERDAALGRHVDEFGATPWAWRERAAVLERQAYLASVGDAFQVAGFDLDRATLICPGTPTLQ